MSPEKFANSVERHIREAHTDGDYEVNVMLEVGQIGIYLPPELMIHDLVTNKKDRDLGFAKAVLERATDFLFELGETPVRATIR